MKFGMSTMTSWEMKHSSHLYQQRRRKESLFILRLIIKGCTPTLRWSLLRSQMMVGRFLWYHWLKPDPVHAASIWPRGSKPLSSLAQFLHRCPRVTLRLWLGDIAPVQASVHRKGTALHPQIELGFRTAALLLQTMNLLWLRLTYVSGP